MINIEGLDVSKELAAVTVITKEQLDGALLVFRTEPWVSSDHRAELACGIGKFLEEQGINARAMVLPGALGAIELTTQPDVKEKL